MLDENTGGASSAGTISGVSSSDSRNESCRIDRVVGWSRDVTVRLLPVYECQQLPLSISEVNDPCIGKYVSDGYKERSVLEVMLISL